MKDKYLNICINLIITKFNHGDPKSWHHKTYVFLSEDIFRETTIQVSADTLKRLFGKKKENSDYDPQKGTRDALAKYLNYEGWANFINSHTHFQIDIKKRKTKKRKTKKRKISPFLLMASVLLVSFTIFINIKKQKKHALVNKDKNNSLVTFFPHEGYAPLAVEITNTSDKLLKIDWEWGQFIELKPKETINAIHTFPGRYIQKVFNKDSLIQNSQILAYNSNWENYIVRGEKYYEVIDSIPYISGAIKRSSVQSVDSNEFWSIYTYINRFEAEADNYQLKMLVQNNCDSGGLLYNDCILYINGENGYQRYHITSKGGEKWIQIVLSEKRFNVNNNTSVEGFAKSLAEKSELRIIVKNKRSSVFLNNENIFVDSYVNPIGQITGFQFIFKGLGMIDDIKLRNEKGKVVYQENF